MSQHTKKVLHKCKFMLLSTPVNEAYSIELYVPREQHGISNLKGLFLLTQCGCYSEADTWVSSAVASHPAFEYRCLRNQLCQTDPVNTRLLSQNCLILYKYAITINTAAVVVVVVVVVMLHLILWQQNKCSTPPTVEPTNGHNPRPVSSISHPQNLFPLDLC